MFRMTPANKIRATVLLLCGVVVACMIAIAAVSEEAPSGRVLMAVAILGIATAIATNFDVTTRVDSSTSGVAMVLVAALVVFRSYGFFLGPMVVGLFGALTISHLRRREWQRLAFNASAESVAILAGAVVYWVLVQPGSRDNPALMLVAAALSALAYLFVNSALVGIPVALSCDERYRDVVRGFAVVDAGGFPFALLGLGLGCVYLSLGAAVVPLLVVPILIARGTFASYLELKAGQEQTIETLILALEAKDRYTAGHAQRVATFCEYVGERMGFGTRRMERLRYAALMHDIGKLVVPNQLLNKPGRLTEGEFERVKRHESVSVDLLRRIDFLAPVAGDTTTEAATAAVDGSGLIEPAIIHVADAFDAMTSTRSYRRALSQETAFGELRAGAGTQFNADCVDALIAAIEDRGEHYGAGHEVDDHEWAVAPPEAGTGSAGLGHLVPEEQVAGS
jgi:HD domain